jgi:hypothetical protein
MFYGQVRNGLWVTIEQATRNRNECARASLGGSLKCALKIRVRTAYP